MLRLAAVAVVVGVGGFRRSAVFSISSRRRSMPYGDIGRPLGVIGRSGERSFLGVLAWKREDFGVYSP